MLRLESALFQKILERDGYDANDANHYAYAHRVHDMMTHDTTIGNKLTSYNWQKHHFVTSLHIHTFMIYVSIVWHFFVFEIITGNAPSKEVITVRALLIMRWSLWSAKTASRHSGSTEKASREMHREEARACQRWRAACQEERSWRCELWEWWSWFSCSSQTIVNLSVTFWTKILRIQTIQGNLFQSV